MDLEEEQGSDRRAYALGLLPEAPKDFSWRTWLILHRPTIYMETVTYIGDVRPEKLEKMRNAIQKGIAVQFCSELGTGDGVVREWFNLVCPQVFVGGGKHFFSCSNNPRRMYPVTELKPHPETHPEAHQRMFRFAGRMMGLALMHKVHIGVMLDKTFYLQLCGSHIYLEDIIDTDPDLHKNLKSILNMKPEELRDLAMNFQIEYDVGEGVIKRVDLCENGQNIYVNDQNRKDYIQLYIQQRFERANQANVSHFANGFDDLVGQNMHQDFFNTVTLDDLDKMLGSNDINLEDWISHTNYEGFSETDDQITWFWQILGSMSERRKQALLTFWTSLTNVPLGGFGDLNFSLCISKNEKSDAHLPESSTCSYLLMFPAYSSETVMRRSLRKITNRDEEFRFMLV